MRRLLAWGRARAAKKPPYAKRATTLAVHRCPAAARSARGSLSVAEWSRRRGVPPRRDCRPRDARTGSREDMPEASAAARRRRRRSARRCLAGWGASPRRTVAWPSAYQGPGDQFRAQPAGPATRETNGRERCVPLSGVHDGQSSGGAFFGLGSLGGNGPKARGRCRGARRNRWRVGSPFAPLVSRDRSDRRLGLSDPGTATRPASARVNRRFLPREQATTNSRASPTTDRGKDKLPAS